MTEATPRSDAYAHIHRDLRRLRRDRAVTLLGYLAIVSVFLAFVFLIPAGDHALERNLSWYVALLLMFAASAAGASLTIGYPLVSRSVLLGASVVLVLMLAAALLLIMDFTSGPAPLNAGATCFFHCTLISGGAMLALGFLSGRLWRRFPNPGWVLALGLAGVGLSALHMQCGGADPIHLLVFHLGPVVLLYMVARALIRLREFVLRDD